MTPFRDLPLARKISRLVVVTSTIVVLLTCAAFGGYEYFAFRHTTLNNVATLARIIADNSTAALSFNNPAEARELVTTLQADPDITAAAVYDVSGQRVAFYHRNRTLPPHLKDVPPIGYEFGDGHLRVYQPIIHGTRRLGTLVIETSMTALSFRIALYIGIAVLVLGISALTAFILARRLQKRITRPVQELAATAQAITAQGDYTMRATRYGDDEFGALTDAFNRMLDDIRQRDVRIGASEERLLSALSAGEMGTWRYDLARRESVVDENFRRLYGLPPGQTPLAADVMTAQIHPEDREPTWAAFDRATRSTDGKYYFEYRVRQPDGSYRWVRDRGRVVRRSDGAVDYVTGALVDITERKQAEREIQRLNADLERRVAQRTAELAQANHELEAFTYSVSHDLRGPLRHVAGYAELIGEDDASQLSEEARSSLTRISRAADRLSRLVDSLLNLSRVGRHQLVLQSVKLDDIVTGALRELESEAQNRRVEWQRQALPTVQGDPGLLAIVFVNLLSNALKYTRPREVAKITIGLDSEAGRHAIFIRDNGVGFDPRFKNKLFGVFERLHNATEFEGTGIGLATVQRIIRKHGGEIWAESDIDKGAAFYFSLPDL